MVKMTTIDSSEFQNKADRLWMIMMCPCDRYTTLVGIVDHKGGHVWNQGVYGKSLYLTLNFAVNLKLL